MKWRVRQSGIYSEDLICKCDYGVKSGLELAFLGEISKREEVREEEDKSEEEEVENFEKEGKGRISVRESEKWEDFEERKRNGKNYTTTVWWGGGKQQKCISLINPQFCHAFTDSR